MGMVYSRDGAAASIMVLEKLIKEIQGGAFDPDDTRSGRVKPVAQSLGPAGESDVVHVKDEVEVIDISDGSSSQSDSSSTSSEEERPKVIKNQPVIQPKAAPEGFVMWQHKKLKTLHLMTISEFLHVVDWPGPYTKSCRWLHSSTLQFVASVLAKPSGDSICHMS